MNKEYINYNFSQADVMRKKQPLPNYIPLEITDVFVCTECGDRINSKILKFYDYQVGLVKCWDCQQKEKND